MQMSFMVLWKSGSSINLEYKQGVLGCLVEMSYVEFLSLVGLWDL